MKVNDKEIKKKKRSRSESRKKSVGNKKKKKVRYKKGNKTNNKQCIVNEYISTSIIRIDHSVYILILN